MLIAPAIESQQGSIQASPVKPASCALHLIAGPPNAAVAHRGAAPAAGWRQRVLNALRACGQPCF